ncbi:MAG: monooxygenase [Rhizobiales bacterium]|jgi:hypothetical protein|nr:monooxygenase [Hyphomicrobiales bacterium]
MILELVLFKSPQDKSRDEILEDAKHTLARWRANADLVRKHYLLSEDGLEGGGVYIWPSREAAEQGHNEEWRESVRKRTGADPVIRYFDLLMLLDNTQSSVTEFVAGEARRIA